MNLVYLITLQILLILSIATVDCQSYKNGLSTGETATTNAASNGIKRKYRKRSTTVETNQRNNPTQSNKLTTVASQNKGTILTTTVSTNQISNATHKPILTTSANLLARKRKYRKRSTTLATPYYIFTGEPIRCFTGSYY